MTKKIYRSAKGKQVDLESLKNNNAKTIAVGKRVNVQGDILEKGKVVKTRAERNKEIYSSPKPAIDDSGFDRNQTSQQPKRK
jgi:hypothetical protein